LTVQMNSFNRFENVSRPIKNNSKQVTKRQLTSKLKSINSRLTNKLFSKTRDGKAAARAFDDAQMTKLHIGTFGKSGTKFEDSMLFHLASLLVTVSNLANDPATASTARLTAKLLSHTLTKLLQTTQFKSEPTILKSEIEGVYTPAPAVRYNQAPLPHPEQTISGARSALDKFHYSSGKRFSATSILESIGTVKTLRRIAADTKASKFNRKSATDLAVDLTTTITANIPNLKIDLDEFEDVKLRVALSRITQQLPEASTNPAKFIANTLIADLADLTQPVIDESSGPVFIENAINSTIRMRQAIDSKLCPGLELSVVELNQLITSLDNRIANA